MKREDDDIDMMEGVVTYTLENKLGGYLDSTIGSADWKKPTPRLATYPLCKEESPNLHFLPTPLSTTPSSFSFPTGSNAWGAMDAGKTHIRNTNGASRVPALVSEVVGAPLSMPRNLPEDTLGEAMRLESASPPPPILFRDPFAHVTAPHINSLAGVGAHRPVSPAQLSASMSPHRQAPGSPSPQQPAQRPPSSDERDYSASRSRDSNPRGTKRARCEEPPKKLSQENLRTMSQSPCPSSESNGNYSRATSMETESHGPARRLATPLSKMKAEPTSSKTVVLHQKVLLLDTINAGEEIKIIKTKEGEFIAIRADEEAEGFMERRQSNAALVAVGMAQKGEKGTENPKSAKKRALEAQTEELVRIWSGHGTEPPAKVIFVPSLESLLSLNDTNTADGDRNRGSRSTKSSL
ncbi:hypothetical protein ABW19_dt0202470 [Dactylella cylindrospora]|nr:hypothetical protein ABW19_dt0202470 [Dactylella cylindrospora]